MSYIGNEPIVSATRTVTEISATAGQTTFTANGGYTVGKVDVIVNGSQLQSSDFTATDGSTVVLTSACALGDDVKLVAWGVFSTGAVTPAALSTPNAVYWDGSGNVGVGTASPTTKLTVVGSISQNTAASGYNAYSASRASRSFAWGLDASGQYGIWDTTSGASNRMLIDTSGNVGIGTTAPLRTLMVEKSAGAVGFGAPYMQVGGGNFAAGGYYTIGFGYTAASYTNPPAEIGYVATSSSGGSLGSLVFATRDVTTNTAPTERMRIDSSGNLLVGTTDSSLSSGVGVKIRPDSAQPTMGFVINTALAGSNYHLYNTNATNNGYRFYVKNNGGIDNYSGNNQNLSDERSKENIELSGNYLEKICSIPVKTFNYKNEPAGEQKTLGVIAQDVEAVAPELVSNEGFGEVPDDGIPLKSIYQTDLTFAMMKAIQELKAELDATKATIALQATEIAALKGTA